MIGKQLAVLIVSLTLLTPASLLGGPEWNSRDCPRSEYSRLHYWTPTVYMVRAYIHPSNLDQYPPGPSSVYIPPTFETMRYRCPTAPAGPTTPYADPAGYYGRTKTMP
jgi:hypothetical protein